MAATHQINMTVKVLLLSYLSCALAQTCFDSTPQYYRCSVLPDDVPNGSMKEVVDAFGQKTLMFSCNPGFVLKGHQILTCNCKRNFWKQPFPTCVPRDCLALYDSGKKESGIYAIMPDGANTIYTYCDMDNGGWTVIQRRVDGSINFDRDWQSYKQGFGNLEGNFWIGLENLFHLTTARNQMNVSLAKARPSDEASATYSDFRVSSEEDGYRLRVSGYNGTFGDGLAEHHGMKFSTYDVDNDKRPRSCAVEAQGGWWFNACFDTNPNGVYGVQMTYHGVAWYPYMSRRFSLAFVEMKIRRI